MTEESRNEVNARAALYVLGLLPPEERRAFGQQIERDEEIRRLVTELEGVLLKIGQAAARDEPPASLRAKLLQRIGREPLPSVIPRAEISPGLVLVFGDGLAWADTGIPGIRVKTLHTDSARRYASCLVSMKKGAIYPRHRHRDLEELFMVSGEVMISGHRLKSGDYCRADAGTLHDEVMAETDCVFIALASQDNEFFPLRA